MKRLIERLEEAKKIGKNTPVVYIGPHRTYRNQQGVVVGYRDDNHYVVRWNDLPKDRIMPANHIQPM